MDRSTAQARSDRRRSQLITWLSLSLAVLVASYALPAAAGHVCTGCHGISSAPATSAYESIPEPEAFAAPSGRSDPSFVGSDESFDSVSYTLSSTTLRFKAGTYTLYRFNVDTGKLLKTRKVRFATARKYRTAHNLRNFGDYTYAKLTSGTWSGWFVRANQAAGSSQTTFAQTRQVRMAKGTHTGVRFYNKQRVTVRRSATLAGAATYEVSRKATFNNKVFFYVSSGPLANRWVAKSTAVKLVSLDSGTTTPPPPPPGPPATWKGILLIYRDTDVTFTRSDGSTYRLQARMSDSMYKLSREVVTKFVSSTAGWSDSYTSMELKIVDVPKTITTIDTLSGGTYWLGPKSIRPDLDKYAPSGTYDSIFVLWQADDSKGVRIPLGGWGLTLPPGPWANGAGYSSITTPAEAWWWTNAKYPQEVFIHEWMHQVLFFHENAGRLKLDLHADGQYGYKKVDGSFRAWLSDVMRGLVKDGSKYLGVSYPIWRAGSPTRPTGW